MDDKVGAFLTGFSTLASYRFGFIAEASILAVPSSFRYPPFEKEPKYIPPGKRQRRYSVMDFHHHGLAPIP